MWDVFDNSASMVKVWLDEKTISSEDMKDIIEMYQNLAGIDIVYEEKSNRITLAKQELNH